MGHRPLAKRADARRLVVPAALAVVAAVAAIGLLAPERSELLLLLAAVPVALLALELGPAAAALTAAAVLADVVLLGLAAAPGSLDLSGIAARGLPALLLGAALGSLGHRHRRRERELRQIVGTYRLIADESSDMISILRPDGRCLFVSKRCRELLGCDPEQLAGRSWLERVHPDDLDEIEHVLEGAGQWRGVHVVAYRLRRADGRFARLETTCRARRDPGSGEIAEIHFASREIGEDERDRIRDEPSTRVARERLKALIASEGVRTVTQPIVELESGRTIGVEALARFPGDSRRGPDLWFERAREAGLACELELAAVRAAIEELEALPGDWFLSVNLSPETLGSPDLLEALGERRHDRIVLELPESAPVEHRGAFERSLEELRRRGLRLAIDAAGSGESSLRRALELSPDMIKLDRSLTASIDADRRQRAVVAAVVAFAATLEIPVVAVGISSEGELRALRELGVELGQGFHLARPAPLEGLARAA